MSGGLVAQTMPRRNHYSPCIDRELVRVLYHEARRRRKPMTVLVDELLTSALQGTHGWQIAHNDDSSVQEQPPQDRSAHAQ